MKTLSLLHFNDVYILDSRKQEPVGGAARFASALKQFEASHPLLLFSGDCFNPSMLSTLTKGRQMVDVLNALGVQAACVGNHDLDYGVENFLELKAACSFPWLLSNVADRGSGQPLAGCLRSTVLEWRGVRVGLLGLVEPEWLETLPALDPDTLLFTDFVEAGRALAGELRAQGAEVVIALTHMRVPNDKVLAAAVPEIDLILGGHDHDYSVDVTVPHGTLLVKSGTDFRDLSFIEVQLQPAAAAAAAPPPGSPKGLSTPPLGSPRAASAEEREEILRRAATRLRGTSVLQRRTFLRKDRLSLKEASAKKIKEASAKGLRLGAEAGAAVGEAAAHFGRLLEGLGRDMADLLGRSESHKAAAAPSHAGAAGAEPASAAGASAHGGGSSAGGEEQSAAASPAVQLREEPPPAAAAAPPPPPPPATGGATAAADSSGGSGIVSCERLLSDGQTRLVARSRRLAVTADLPEDPEVAAIVQRYNDQMGASMGQVVGYTAVDLDGRFASVRTSETNLGNFITDILREACHCDVALINSGTLRSDAVHPAGKLTNKDLISILPMMDETIVIEVTGQQLLTALENGVSQYPVHEGRFPQVSGISFAFDPSQLPGSRVVPGSVAVGGSPLQPDATYSLGTKAYMAEGRDGYDVLKGSPVLLDTECAEMLPTAVRNHFTLLSVLNKWVDVPTWRVAANKMLQGHVRRTSGQRLLEEQQQGQLAGAAAEGSSGAEASCGSGSDVSGRGGAAGGGGSRNAVQNRITSLWEIAPAVEGRIRSVAVQ